MAFHAPEHCNLKIDLERPEGQSRCLQKLAYPSTKGESSMFLFPDARTKHFADEGVWRDLTILDVLEQHAVSDPKAEALVDPANRAELIGGPPKRLDYKKLLAQVERLASHFIRMGIKKDDIIAVQLPNIVELVIVYLSAARVGAIVTPMGVAYRRHEMAHIFKMCEPVAYIGPAVFNKFKHVEMVTGLQPEFTHLKWILSVGRSERPSGVVDMEDLLAVACGEEYLQDSDRWQPQADEVFSICWTSGTEAEPKGVPRTHNNWIVTGALNTTICRLPPKCTLLATFPMINMAGIGAAFMTWIFNGGKLVLHHPFDPNTYLKQISDENIYYTMAPPALLTMLDNLPQWSATDKSSLKVLATGGSPLQSWLVKKYRDAYGMDIVNEFASNEGVGILTSALFLSDPEDRAVYFPRYGVSEIEWDGFESISDPFSKKVLEATRTKIVDPASRNEILEPGIPGELLYAGPGVFPAYWKRPDLTSNAFDEEGFYCSGDLFSIEGDARDKYLFHGRLKDLIIRGGQNISPEEIENIAISHPKIREVAAVGYPDTRLGEKLCLVVATLPGETLALKEITDLFQQRGVAIYKHPERLEIIDALPRNALNKVEKKKLRKMVANRLHIRN